MIEIKVKDFDIEQIADSGECFRWNKIEDNKYRGIFAGKVCEIEQKEDILFIDGFTKEEFEEIGVNYFDLDRDYGEVKEFYRDDEILTKAIKDGEGIRILNQDKFETLISFIISANNNIPRIKSSVEKISTKYGKKIEFKGQEYFAFPTPEELSSATETELRECGVGFRDKYIIKVAKEVAEGRIDLDEISKLPTDKCKKELMKITGVGPKVADCVMLFSMKKADAFPVDVWIKRIMEELYLKKETSLKDIEKFGKAKFGKFAGIAQQYLFYSQRGKNKKL